MTVSPLNPEACWLISTTTGGGVKASRLLGLPRVLCKVWPKRRKKLFYYLHGAKTWKNEFNPFSDISKSIQQLHLSQESCGKPEICSEKLALCSSSSLLLPCMWADITPNNSFPNYNEPWRSQGVLPAESQHLLCCRTRDDCGSSHCWWEHCVWVFSWGVAYAGWIWVWAYASILLQRQ